MGTIIKSMNRIYDVQETRPLLKKYALAVGLTALAGMSIVGALVLMFAGQFAGEELADEVGIGTAGLFTLLRLPVAAALLLLGTAFVYWIAPNLKLPFRWISPGTVLFVAGWLLMSSLFGLYVANFGSYDSTYGALGGIVVLLAWLYFTSLLLLAGAELNATLAQHYEPTVSAQVTEAPAPEGGRWPLTLLRRRSVPDGRAGRSGAVWKWAPPVAFAVYEAALTAVTVVRERGSPARKVGRSSSSTPAA
jgi:membrane protein